MAFVRTSIESFSALIARIQSEAIALDPVGARARTREAEKRARVVARRRPSGTADLAGKDLPVTDAAGAQARVFGLASRAKRAGVALPIDRLRPAVRGFRSRRLDHLLGPELLDPFRKLAAQAGATLYAALFAAFRCALRGRRRILATWRRRSFAR